MSQDSDGRESATGAARFETCAPKATEDHIRRRAYAIWIEEGRPDGRALNHWLRARWELEQAPDPKYSNGGSASLIRPGNNPNRR